MLLDEWRRKDECAGKKNDGPRDFRLFLELHVMKEGLCGIMDFVLIALSWCVNYWIIVWSVSVEVITVTSTPHDSMCSDYLWRLLRE